jgi:hypothetical protein
LVIAKTPECLNVSIIATIVLDCQGIDDNLETVPEITRNHQPAFLRGAIAPLACPHRSGFGSHLFFSSLPALAPPSSRLKRRQIWLLVLSFQEPRVPGEFIKATGARAALLGNESSRFDAWVYPLKILRNFFLFTPRSIRSLPTRWPELSSCAPNPPLSFMPQTCSPFSKPW